MIPKVGDRVGLKKDSKLRTWNVGNGKGIIIGVNPYHLNTSFNIKFDGGSTINNVHIEDLDCERYSPEQVVFT